LNQAKIFFRVHAVQRLFERDVSVKKVLGAIETGETIENYSSEMPEQSRLIFGSQGKRPFHVVISEIPKENEVIVIKVYTPDPEKWSNDFKSRRS
jgi:hypothetical protein